MYKELLQLNIKRQITWAGHKWLMPKFPSTQEAEIRRIMVQSQPRQKDTKPQSQ
jgi:hypothetical protein